MGWRTKNENVNSLGFLDSEDIAILMNKYGFTFNRGLYSRYLNNDIRDTVSDSEITLHGFLKCLDGTSLKTYARTTITAKGVAVEYESNWGSLEGSWYVNTDTKEDLDYELDELFAKYE